MYIDTDRTKYGTTSTTTSTTTITQLATCNNLYRTVPPPLPVPYTYLSLDIKRCVLLPVKFLVSYCPSVELCQVKVGTYQYGTVPTILCIQTVRYCTIIMPGVVQYYYTLLVDIYSLLVRLECLFIDIVVLNVPCFMFVQYYSMK